MGVRCGIHRRKGDFMARRSGQRKRTVIVRILKTSIGLKSGRWRRSLSKHRRSAAPLVGNHRLRLDAAACGVDHSSEPPWPWPASAYLQAASGYCAAFGAMGINTRGGEPDTNRLGRRKVQTGQATKIRRSIEINRSPNELYRFWRSFDNLPRVMSHLQSVQVVNERLSHWVVKTLPGAPAVEWDAEIINDVQDERIGWRSLRGADVDNTGSVEFEPSGDGRRTRLTVTLQYAPPPAASGRPSPS